MIKLILIISLSLGLGAYENYELKLYEKILPLITRKSTIKIYADNSTKELLKGSKTFIFVDNCKNAELIIGKVIDVEESTCKAKPLFATSYRAFKNSKNAIGAFYWRKGRPQLQLNKNSINEFKLYIPQKLKRYAQWVVLKQAIYLSSLQYYF